MATSVIHVPKSEAISNIASLLDRAFEGAEVVIEDGPRTVKLISPGSASPGRLLSNPSPPPAFAPSQQLSTKTSPPTCRQPSRPTANRLTLPAWE